MGLDQDLEELVVDRLVRAPLGVEDQDRVVLVGRLFYGAAEDLAVGQREGEAMSEAGDVGSRSAAKHGEHDPVDGV